MNTGVANKILNFFKKKKNHLGLELHIIVQVLIRNHLHTICHQLVLNIVSWLFIAKINSKKEVCSSNHNTPGVPMISLPKSKQIHFAPMPIVVNYYSSDTLEQFVM